VDELEGADVAEFVTMAKSSDATLIGLPQTTGRRGSADRIVAVIDCRAAALQGNGRGGSAVRARTIRIQPGVHVEDIATTVADGCAGGFANQGICRRNRA